MCKSRKWRDVDADAQGECAAVTCRVGLCTRHPRRLKVKGAKVLVRGGWGCDFGEPKVCDLEADETGVEIHLGLSLSSVITVPILNLLLHHQCWF